MPHQTPLKGHLLLHHDLMQALPTTRTLVQVRRPGNSTEASVVVKVKVVFVAVADVELVVVVIVVQHAIKDVVAGIARTEGTIAVAIVVEIHGEVPPAAVLGGLFDLVPIGDDPRLLPRLLGGFPFEAGMVLLLARTLAISTVLLSLVVVVIVLVVQGVLEGRKRQRRIGHARRRRTRLGHDVVAAAVTRGVRTVKEEHVEDGVGAVVGPDGRMGFDDEGDVVAAIVVFVLIMMVLVVFWVWAISKIARSAKGLAADAMDGDAARLSFGRPPLVRVAEGDASRQRGGTSLRHGREATSGDGCLFHGEGEASGGMGYGHVAVVVIAVAMVPRGSDNRTVVRRAD